MPCHSCGESRARSPRMDVMKTDSGPLADPSGRDLEMGAEAPPVDLGAAAVPGWLGSLRRQAPTGKVNERSF